MKWEPIATAPKDGSSILLYEPQGDHEGLYCVAYWDDKEKIWTTGNPSEIDGSLVEEFPTHWMPLPAAPEKGT